MVLHAREWGDGDRVALLIHGMAGDGDDWAPVAPLIRLLSRMKEERTPRAPETAAWDVDTTADAWVGVAGQDLTPPAHAVPSLLVRAEPSSYVTPEVVRDLAARGFTISSVPGATHNVWYDGRERLFVDALGDWL
jgi:pimeloyl-ACP methyl ester carboxylesterase